MRYSVAIPHSNYSQNIGCGWFVISLIHVCANENEKKEIGIGTAI